MILPVLLGVLMSVSGSDLPWWKIGPVYQIYPTSYADSDGDGWGDLQGIINHADYIKDLGVAAIWLSPIYPSPMRDNGYDAANYTDVNPRLGNLTVAENLIKVFHEKGVKVILDFVPNHTSNDSAWFQDSIQRKNGKDDWYVWRDPKGYQDDGTPIPPNNWRSLFGGSAWTFEPTRKQFFFHQFGTYQTDLNYANPVVVKAIQDCLRFWLSRGIDGFRMDAVPYVYESNYDKDEPTVCQDESDYNCLSHIYTMNQQGTHDVLNGFDSVLREDQFTKIGPRAMWVEAYNNITELVKYYGNVSSPFNFQYVSYIKKNSNASEFDKYTTEFLNNLNGHWPNWVVGNHDNSRVGTRMGPDMIDSMNIINQLLPGTSIVYYGEELGMEDTQGIPDSRRQDHASNPSRDPERTPMQWDTSVNAGFSSADSSKLYLPVNPNYYDINTKTESAKDSANSHLEVFKTAVKMHKDHIDSTPLGVKTGTLNGWIFAFQRPGLVVVTNLNNEDESFKIEDLKLNKTDSLKVALAPQNAAYKVGRKVSPTEKINIRPRSTIVFTTGGANFIHSSFILIALTSLLPFWKNH